MEASCSSSAVGHEDSFQDELQDSTPEHSRTRSPTISTNGIHLLKQQVCLAQKLSVAVSAGDNTGQILVPPKTNAACVLCGITETFLQPVHSLPQLIVKSGLCCAKLGAIRADQFTKPEVHIHNSYSHFLNRRNIILLTWSRQGIE